MRRFLFTPLLVLATLPALAAERWETLPPTPAPIATDRSDEAQVNGISIHYAIYGQGSPVIFLHGGLANADYWGGQVAAGAAHRTVVLMGGRGDGPGPPAIRPAASPLLPAQCAAALSHLKVAG